MRREGGGGGLRPDRGRQYGECDQADLDRARPRRDPLHAAMFRRGGRPACLPGRRRARHRNGDDPPARRRAQRLWHGAGRHGRAPAADAGRGRAGGGAGRAGGGGAGGAGGAGGRGARKSCGARRCATRAAISTLEVPVSGQMRADFEAAHKARFGFDAPETEVVVETAIVEAVGKGRSCPGGGRESRQARGLDPGLRRGTCMIEADLRSRRYRHRPRPDHRPLPDHRRRARLARRGRSARQPDPHPLPAPRRRQGGRRGRSGACSR